MKTGTQRDAHDLKRARVTTGRLWKIERLDAGLALQQRHHARLHLVAVVHVHGRGQCAFHIVRGGVA